MEGPTTVRDEAGSMIPVYVDRSIHIRDITVGIDVENSQFTMNWMRLLSRIYRMVWAHGHTGVYGEHRFTEVRLWG